MRRFSRPLALLAAAALVASADTVFLHDNVTYEGKVVSQTDDEVVLQPYHSTMKEMVWGLKRFPKEFVERVEITPEEPIRTYWFRASDPKADHVELMKFCLANSLAVEAREEALEILAADPANADARATVGAGVDAVLKASPRHNKDITVATAGWATFNSAQRAAAYAGLKKDFGVTLPQEYFDRVARSKALPAGVVTDDVHLSYNTAHAHGVYTVWVPKNYDPNRAYPMLLTLHGTWNGLGGIGEGHTFIKHFTYAETKKWDVIIISPTADPRPWTAQGDAFVLSVIDEAMLLYNIDMNRVYVTGHSMGGGGTWYFGTKFAEKFAAFAPAAAAGSGNELNAAEQGTGMYIYHSADDPSAGVGPDRAAARNLLRVNADFVYTEWTDQQHGWPQAVIADSFLYFRHHHRMERGKDKPKVIHGTRPSFAEPSWPNEESYFPAPREAGRNGELEELLGQVALGGVVAEKAATRLLELKDPRSRNRLVAIMQDMLANCHEARMQAARSLGALHNSSVATDLLNAMGDPSWIVRQSAADALATAGGEPESKWLAAALHAFGAEFDVLAERWIRDESWTQIHALNASIVATLAAYADSSVWTTVEEVAIRKILLTDAKSGSDNIDPEPARRASAVRILKVLPAFKDPRVRLVIGAIRDRLNVPEVTKAADEAESKLDK